MSSNRFPATCAKCGNRVEPGDGTVNGKRGNDWRVVHHRCFPPDQGSRYGHLKYDL